MEPLLKQLGQDHLLRSDALVRQAGELDAQYPGGLRAYVANARRLLQQASVGDNPLDGWKPSVPSGIRVEALDAEFDSLEAQGRTELASTAFVLVAGGLGERLGFNGIKVALPRSQLNHSQCFLSHYAEYIRAFGSSESTPPLAIMTSQDTHDRTFELLNENNYFGLPKERVTLMKQEKVAALSNQDAKFAVETVDGVELIVTKPHGHGDVHALLHSRGLLSQWRREGIRHVVFFQDTNGLVMHGLPALLGAHETNGFMMTSLTVPRRPGEAVGAICSLTRESDGCVITCNVEYNQLESVLRASPDFPKGDVGHGESKHSLFPGNINVFVLRLPEYEALLARTDGAVPEFVNPKYKDESRSEFKTPTRLECMMQDLPKLLADLPAESRGRVGFVELPRWLCFSAVKNNVVDAAAKVRRTGFAESAASGESDVYAAAREMLRSVCVRVHNESESDSLEFAGIPFKRGALVQWDAQFAADRSQLASRFPQPEQVTLGPRASLLLRGNVVVRQLQLLEGHIELDGRDRSVNDPLVVDGDCDSEQQITLVPVDVSDMGVSEALRVRAFRFLQLRSD
ncbi:MAG: hypothetical protein MHM6MM_007552 [Cercozoa sp. M6MM]